MFPEIPQTSQNIFREKIGKFEKTNNFKFIESTNIASQYSSESRAGYSKRLNGVIIRGTTEPFDLVYVVKIFSSLVTQTQTKTIFF